MKDGAWAPPGTLGFFTGKLATPMGMVKKFGLRTCTGKIGCRIYVFAFFYFFHGAIHSLNHDSVTHMIGV